MACGLAKIDYRYVARASEATRGAHSLHVAVAHAGYTLLIPDPALSHNSGAPSHHSALVYRRFPPVTISADNHPDLSPVATRLALRNISVLAKAAPTGQKKSRKKKRQRRTI